MLSPVHICPNLGNGPEMYKIITQGYHVCKVFIPKPTPLIITPNTSPPSAFPYATTCSITNTNPSAYDQAQNNPTLTCPTKNPEITSPVTIPYLNLDPEVPITIKHPQQLPYKERQSPGAMELWDGSGNNNREESGA